MPKTRIQKRLYYKIGEACKALDIQPYVLRYWETEFAAISPSKSRSGQRVYSEKELEIIRRIKQLLYDEGYTIAGAKKKLEGELASGTLSRADEDGEAAEAAPPSPRERRAAPPPAAAPPEAESAPLQVPLQLEGQLDTQGGERIQRLRSGVQRALAETREILALLGSRTSL
jgi:DNA-binding transcriptional MerR regulator